MRIAHFETDTGAVVYAIQQEDGRFVRAEDGTLHATEEVVTPRRWLPPIEPRVIMCIGRNYRAHAAEQGAAAPEYPILFIKNPSAATGHLEPVRIPKVCEDEVDYEGELVVVIGKAARDVPRDEALDHVFGYTIGHDVSARVWQEKKGGSQWCRGKGFDTFAPLGPVIVTADEIPAPSVLTVRTFLNGDLMQEGNASSMLFDVTALIEFLSQDTTLLPGTMIMTGTPEGIGWARDPKVTLKPGDVVTVEIEPIGRLTNPIVSADS